MSKPIFIVVHGAWHRGAHFELVASELHRHGYKTVAVDLPSVTEDASAAPSNADADTACVREAIMTELDNGNDVIVSCHSYGGIPATNALPDLDTASRSAAGHTTSVLAIAPIASFLVPAGMNVTQDRGESVSSGYYTVEPPLFHLELEKVKENFYHDVDDRILPKYNALLKPMTFAALADNSKYTAYEKIPVHYLFCDDDKVFPPDQQQMMVDRIERDGCGLRVEHVKASHSPFLSMPGRVADFLRRSAGEDVPI